MSITMVQVSKLHDDLFLRKHIFGLKHHLPLYLEGKTQCTLRFSGVPVAMVQVSKLHDDPLLRKHILAKTSLSFVFRGPNTPHPEVFRCADCNGTCCCIIFLY